MEMNRPEIRIHTWTAAMLGFLHPRYRAAFMHMPLANRTAFLLLVLAGLLDGARAESGLPLAELVIESQRIQVEVAGTPAAQVSGLMHRKVLPEHRGMLFAYAESGALCMWMKNTLIPLSVAFIDAEARIINIEDMQPGTRDLHCASRPAQYALEMNRGWFRNNGIKSGDTVSGLENLPGGKK